MAITPLCRARARAGPGARGPAPHSGRRLLAVAPTLIGRVRAACGRPPPRAGRPAPLDPTVPRRL
jgi:hypothetical protein